MYCTTHRAIGSLFPIDLSSAETFLSHSLTVRCSFPEAECESHSCGRRVGRRVVSAAIWRRARGERAIVFSILPSRQKVGHELSGINTARNSAIISPAIERLVCQAKSNPPLSRVISRRPTTKTRPNGKLLNPARRHTCLGASGANICRAACTSSRARI